MKAVSVLILIFFGGQVSAFTGKLVCSHPYSYYGGYVVTLSEIKNATVLAIVREQGPDGDGAYIQEQVFDGKVESKSGNVTRVTFAKGSLTFLIEGNSAKLKYYADEAELGCQNLVRP